MKKYGIAAAVFAALTIFGTDTARADSYGAISLSPSTGALGWSFDFNARYPAERYAQDRCYRHASDCRVAIWFKDSCGAVARGPDGWGADWAESSYRAQQKALASCSRHSYDCRVVRWQCSGAR